MVKFVRDPSHLMRLMDIELSASVHIQNALFQRIYSWMEIFSPDTVILSETFNKRDDSMPTE